MELAAQDRTGQTERGGLAMVLANGRRIEVGLGFNTLQMPSSNLRRGPKKRTLLEAIANPRLPAQSLECVLEQILR